MNSNHAIIAGLGHALPEAVITNADLEKIVETSDDWITTRTGIKNRHKAAPDEYTSTFATRAARAALERAGVDAADLDMIICATVCPDMALPSTAVLIQSYLGAKKAAAFDITAACSGFLYALTIADQFIASGTHQNILIIGAELLTRYVDYTDRSTCVIFGDGAGAAVIRRSPDARRGVLAARIQSDGDFAYFLYTPGGGTRHPASHASVDERLHYIKMKGNELFKVAVRSMEDLSRKVLDEVRMSPNDIDLLVPHQANQRITDAVADRLGIPAEKVYSNIAQIGNTSSASIPICLDELSEAGRLKPGMIVMMTSFGAGATWGSVLMRW
ncbi:MAG TPA: beta-ketoacyl-ACP synthase III [Blastocatellia bacterium]|nr:beta-ketoacyl-ACP synthase III [Blastocatellia bacterium]